MDKIKKLFNQYQIKVWKPEVIDSLSEYTYSQVEKICKELARKKASGEIKNSGGYLASHPKEICETILTSEPPSKNYNDEYEIYVPPQLGG